MENTVVGHQKICYNFQRAAVLQGVLTSFYREWG